MSWLKDAIQICDKSTWEFKKKTVNNYLTNGTKRNTASANEQQ